MKTFMKALFGGTVAVLTGAAALQAGDKDETEQNCVLCSDVQDADTSSQQETQPTEDKTV